MVGINGSQEYFEGIFYEVYSHNISFVKFLIYENCRIRNDITLRHTDASGRLP